VLDTLPSACVPKHEGIGETRIPLTAPIHLQREDIVIHIPYGEGDLERLEARDVSPVLKVITDDIAGLALPPLHLQSRPYALTFEVDRTDPILSPSDCDRVIAQVEAAVFRHCQPLPDEGMAIHSVIPTWGASD
jgi:hypothetical protein